MSVPSPVRPNVAEIDLDALAKNYRLLLSLLRPGTRVIASVKGNAYGLGIEQVATKLADLGVPTFATGSIQDAMQIRGAGLGTEIVMFGGALPAAMPEFVSRGLIPTVHNLDLAKAVSAAASARHPVYIKIDVGFGRLGFPLSSAKASIQKIAALPRIEVRGLYTHVPFSDAKGKIWAQERLAAFDAFAADLADSGLSIPITQARATGCILAGLEDNCSAVSPGGFLYGRSPLMPGLSNIEEQLQPVLRSVCSRLIHVDYSAGDRTVKFPSRFAHHVTGPTGVIPFGRAEGNRAPVSGQTAHMLIRGRRAPVLGVSSEHCVIDLSSVPNPVIGDEVVIIGRSEGEEIRLSDVAASQQTTGSDILLAMSGRIPRVFRHNNEVS